MSNNFKAHVRLTLSMPMQEEESLEHTIRVLTNVLQDTGFSVERLKVDRTISFPIRRSSD